MYPVIFRIGNFVITSYGVMLVIAFLVGTWIAEKRAEKRGIDRKHINDLVLWVVLGTIIGARLMYVIFHWNEFADDLIGIIAFWRGGLGGLMYYGGFILSFIFGLIFVKVKKIPLLKMLDVVALPLALGQGIGRIGCFLNGCCFGNPSHTCGIKFPHYSPAGYIFPDTPVIPTQLFHSFAGFLIALIIFLFERNKNRPHGSSFAIFITLFGLQRFLIDFIRYYENFANYIINQIVASLLIITGIVMFIYVWKRKVS